MGQPGLLGMRQETGNGGQISNISDKESTCLQAGTGAVLADQVTAHRVKQVLSHQVSFLQATATCSKNFVFSAAVKPPKSNAIIYITTEETHKERYSTTVTQNQSALG